MSVEPGSTGTLVPNLALAVPRPQDGGRTYTFHLRSGLRYWTGRRARASDFREAWDWGQAAIRRSPGTCARCLAHAAARGSACAAT